VERTEEPDVTLRPATAEDAEEIAELYLAVRRATVPAMPPQIHTSAEVHAYVAREVTTHEVWVAVDEEILGFAVLSAGWLDSLYVGPQHQGTGIGSALLDVAKAQRPGGFALWVFASNAPARGFYRRHGLVELEHTDGSGNEERSPDVRMAWPGEDPLTYLRGQIDEVDGELALQLARRAALTAAIQGYKARSGHEGRDPEREQEIARRMADRAPGLDAAMVQRIMHTVIEESLDAYESRRQG
jgi:chorismate mutase/GNAT superfamily N-acetyltransferase